EPFPDLQKARPAELLKQLGSSSAFARLYAQREILRRGSSAEVRASLARMAGSSAPLPQRIAAIFTLEQLAGPAARNTLLSLGKDRAVREFVLRAVADDKAVAAPVPSQPFVAALSDANPRVRLQAVTALG